MSEPVFEGLLFFLRKCRLYAALYRGGFKGKKEAVCTS